jgi:hypothetical protein
MASPADVVFWLGVIAVATSVQTLLLVAAAIAGWRVYRNTSAALERFERDHVAPSVARLNSTLDDVRDVASRVRSVDDRVRHALSSTGARAVRAASHVQSGIWPVFGLGRGLWAAVSAFTRRRESSAEAWRAGATRP